MQQHIRQRSTSHDRKRQKKRKRQDRSQQQKKKKKDKDYDHSNDNKKKDKDKKKHRSKSKDRFKEQRKDKDKQKDIDYQKEKQYQSIKSKERQRDRQYRQKDRDRQHRQKDRDNRQRNDDYDNQRQRQRNRDRDRSRDRKQRREKDRSRSKKRQYRQRSTQRKHKNDKYKGYEMNKDKIRQDKYQRWRKQARFRFDSPPKSDQSDMSDDPEKMDKLNKMKAEKQLVTSKADKKLYLGNLPPNITSNQLMQMLNSALKKMQINCQSDGDSIISAWISPDGVGHYAFVQFRTAQQATAGLALNGASLYGYQLKLGRPKQYIQYHKQLLSQFGSDGNIDTILRKVQAMGGFLTPPIIQQRLVYPPSKVLVLKHIVTIQQLAIDEQYTQILQDITQMAKRHGQVLNVTIPRPMEIDLQQVKTRVKGLGYIFIKYKTLEQAKYARKQFIKCMFSQRSVACSFFPQKKFIQADLDVIDRIIIDF